MAVTAWEMLEDLAYAESQGPANMGKEGELSAQESKPPSWGTDVTLLGSFTAAGFESTPDFRKDWARLSTAGRVGTVREFRKLFCNADHYEVDRVVHGKPITNGVAVVWGYPMVYALKGRRNPLLGRIAPKGWHLSQVGRSVPTPPFCKR